MIEPYHETAGSLITWELRKGSLVASNKRHTPRYASRDKFEALC